MSEPTAKQLDERIQDTADRLHDRLRAIGGCGAGSCVVDPPKGGMVTNGPCFCVQDKIKLKRVIHSYRKFEGEVVNARSALATLTPKGGE